MGYFVCLALLSVSCNETDENLSIKKSTQPEVLSFNSYDQFKTITGKISSMPQKDFESWEKENSFKSYRSVLVEADEEWAAVDSEEKQASFLGRYEDVLSIQDGFLIPHIKIGMYQSIINREGIYKTENHFHKVIGDFKVTVKKEDRIKLNHIRVINGEPQRMEGVNILRYTGDSEKNTINARTQVATCTNNPTYKEAEYFLTASKCKDGRKAYISARSFIDSYTGTGDFNGTQRYGDFYQSAVEIKLWAKKRNSFCGWNDYATQLEWRSIEYTIRGWITTGYEPNRTLAGLQQFVIPLAPHDTGGDVSSYFEIFKFGHAQFNNAITVNPFIKIYGEGKSRGIDNNWAVIFCQ